MSDKVEITSAANDNLGELNISPEVSSASEDTAGAILRALYRANATLAGILGFVGSNEDPSMIIEALEKGRRDVDRIIPNKAANDNNVDNLDKAA